MLRWEESVTPKQPTRKIRDVDKDGFVTLKWKKDKPKTRKTSIRDVIATKKKQQDKFVELAELHFFYMSILSEFNFAPLCSISCFFRTYHY